MEPVSQQAAPVWGMIGEGGVLWENKWYKAITKMYSNIFMYK